MLCLLASGTTAFYGGQTLLSSTPRSRACVASQPNEPQKTARGVDINTAASELSKMLREQEEAEAALQATVEAAEKTGVDAAPGLAALENLRSSTREVLVQRQAADRAAAELEAAKKRQHEIEKAAEEKRLLEAELLANAKAAVSTPLRSQNLSCICDAHCRPAPHYLCAGALHRRRCRLGPPARRSRSYLTLLPSSTTVPPLLRDEALPTRRQAAAKDAAEVGKALGEVGVTAGLALGDVVLSLSFEASKALAKEAGKVVFGVEKAQQADALEEHFKAFN